MNKENPLLWWYKAQEGDRILLKVPRKVLNELNVNSEVSTGEQYMVSVARNDGKILQLSTIDGKELGGSAMFASIVDYSKHFELLERVVTPYSSLSTTIEGIDFSVDDGGDLWIDGSLLSTYGIDKLQTLLKDLEDLKEKKRAADYYHIPL